MEDILLNCNHCGNVLETKSYKIMETCPYCSTTLEIIRTDNSIYTKICLDVLAVEPPLVLENPIKEAVEEENKERLDLMLFNQTVYKEIRVLEDEWNQNLPQHTKSGLLPIKSNEDEIVVGLITSVLGLIFLTLSVTANVPFFIVLGLGFIVYALVNYNTVNTRKVKYFKAQKEYEGKRQLLEQKLKVVPKLNHY